MDFQIQFLNAQLFGSSENNFEIEMYDHNKI